MKLRCTVCITRNSNWKCKTAKIPTDRAISVCLDTTVRGGEVYVSCKGDGFPKGRGEIRHPLLRENILVQTRQPDTPLCFQEQNKLPLYHDTAGLRVPTKVIRDFFTSTASNTPALQLGVPTLLIIYVNFFVFFLAFSVGTGFPSSIPFLCISISSLLRSYMAVLSVIYLHMYFKLLHDVDLAVVKRSNK
jgi:hypothetical protein